jgi:arylsulfatase A-like enzyme
MGEKIGERAYGSFCYDYTIKTFANYNSPDLSSSEFNYQVSHVDFMPTILDELQIPQDKNYENLDGQTLLNAMKGEKYEERFVYTETANPLQERAPPKQPNTKSIRNSTWKLILNEYDNSKELYNLLDDPNEINNLINEDIEIKNILWDSLQKFQDGRTQDDFTRPLSKRD